MNILSTIAEAFLLLGKAIDPESVTQVSFAFEYQPSDLEGESIWEFKATLNGKKELAQSGEETVLAYTQQIQGQGGTAEEAARAGYRYLVSLITHFADKRKGELAFAEQAVLLVNSKSEGDLILEGQESS